MCYVSKLEKRIYSNSFEDCERKQTTAGLFLIPKKNLKYFCHSAMETAVSNKEILHLNKMFIALDIYLIEQPVSSV